MRYSILLAAATALVLTLAASPGRGQDSRPDGTTTQLAELQKAVERLEEKIDRLSQQPSEFSPVSIRVVDQERRPLSGFEVRVSSVHEAERAFASGTSNEEGVALQRQLPYGHYRVSVQGDGWRLHDLATVEVGTPLVLTVVAPTPETVGAIRLNVALDEEAVAGMPFGEWRLKIDSTNSWGASVAPEPNDLEDEFENEESHKWRSFPTFGDGVERVAVELLFSLERKVEQPDGDDATWHWVGGAEQGYRFRWLLQGDGSARPILSTAEERLRITDPQGAFGELHYEEGDSRAESERGKRLGYAVLKLGEAQASPVTIKAPAGEVQVRVGEVYGRPSVELLKAVGLPARSPGAEVWLPVTLTGDSEWIHRLVGKNELQVEVVADEEAKLTIGGRE